MMEGRLTKPTFSKSLLSPLRSGGKDYQVPLPAYVYRNCRSAISCLEVVSVNLFNKERKDFLWAGEEDGYITVYDLSNHRMVLRFSTMIDTSFKNSPNNNESLSIISILDLKGGYVLTYNRFLGIQVWLWEFEVNKASGSFNSELLSGSLSSRETCVPKPKMVAILVINSVSFCGLSIAENPISENNQPGPDLNHREIWLLAPHLNTHQLQLMTIKLPSLTTKPEDSPTLAAFVPTLQHVKDFDFSDIDPKTVMSIKLYSPPLQNCSIEPRLFFLIGFDDGTVSWYCINLNKESNNLKFNFCQLLWSLDTLHTEPVMGIAVAQDLQSGYSVGADNQVARFIFNYSGIKAANSSRPKTSSETFFKLPILSRPNEENKTLKIAPTGPGSVCISTRSDGRVLALGHFNLSVGLYSAISLRPLARLDFHRKQISCGLYYVPPQEHNSIHFSADAPCNQTHFLFVGSQDSRISLWQARRPKNKVNKVVFKLVDLKFASKKHKK